MDTGYPNLPNSPYNDAKKLELVFTHEQSKKLASILPRGYSLTHVSKNLKKNTKNQNKKNQFQLSSSKSKEKRRKNYDQFDVEDSEVNSKRCNQILKLIKQNQNCKPFLYPVDPEQLEIPDYFTIIKNPMDLQTVEDKLRKDDYSNDKEFEDDIELIWNNALLYNMEGTQVHDMARYMKEEFHRIISMNDEELFFKKQPSKLMEMNRPKIKFTQEKPLNPQESAKLIKDIKMLEEHHLLEIKKKIFQHIDMPFDQLDLSLDLLPPKAVKELQRYVNQKMPMIRMKKRQEEEEARAQQLKQMKKEQSKPQVVNPYQSKENTLQTNMPIISNYDQKEEAKQINHDSSDSSLISDLESD